MKRCWYQCPAGFSGVQVTGEGAVTTCQLSTLLHCTVLSSAWDLRVNALPSSAKNLLPNIRKLFNEKSAPSFPFRGRLSEKLLRKLSRHFQTSVTAYHPEFGSALFALRKKLHTHTLNQESFCSLSEVDSTSYSLYSSSQTPDKMLPLFLLELPSS